MEKPVPEYPMSKSLIYNKCQKWVGKVLGKDLRNYAGNSGHFKKWKDAKGYGDTDPEGKKWGSSQIWYAEYNADPKGKATCPPYLDFWHWIIDQTEVSNGCIIWLPIHEADSLDEDKQWVAEILRTFKKEFAEYIVDEDEGFLPMYVSW